MLLGLTFSLLVTLVAAYYPDASDFSADLATKGQVAEKSSDFTYYAFVTFTTLGYGDLLPTAPVSKSLATLMGVTGQLYVAVILAMLVGKYSSSRAQSE